MLVVIQGEVLLVVESGNVSKVVTSKVPTVGAAVTGATSSIAAMTATVSSLSGMPAAMAAVFRVPTAVAAHRGDGHRAARNG